MKSIDVKKKLKCKDLPLVFLKILDKNPDDCCSSELRGPNVVSLVGKGSHCDMLLNTPKIYGHYLEKHCKNVHPLTLQTSCIKKIK